MNGKEMFLIALILIQKTRNTSFQMVLGGQKLFMPCVCEKCNNDFSKLEGELYQKGISALMRSVEGVTKQKKQNKPTYFKAPILLTFDEENKIVYEVNQNNEFKISLKSQIIKINSKFHLESSSQKRC